MNWLNCPFCGNNLIEVREDYREDSKFRGGYKFCFTSCYYCRAQGPNFYKLEMDDEEFLAYANKLWNERKDINELV